MLLLRLACVGVVLALGFSVALAEQFAGIIRKIDGDKITISKFPKTKLKKGEKLPEATVKMAKKVKVLSTKFNDEKKKFVAADALKDGLKNERFKDLKKSPVFARFVTDDDGKVTEIHVFPSFKKKPKKAD